MKEWTDERRTSTEVGEAVNPTGKRGNFRNKRTRVPSTLACHAIVRDFIREKRMNRERVTARQVLECLVMRGFIHVEMHSRGIMEQKSLDTALRAVQRYLCRKGFLRGSTSLF